VWVLCACLVLPPSISLLPIYWHLNLTPQVYTSLLALPALSVTTRAGAVANVHLTLLLAVAWGVFFYRDIFPFATYTWPEQDASEGPLLKAKLVALTLAAVVIPLLTPRTYIPVDPKVCAFTFSPFCRADVTRYRTQCPCPTPSRPRPRSHCSSSASSTP
jgi:hypothetical protein